jgi:hypothetical protein
MRVSEGESDRSGRPSRWSGSTSRLAPTGGPGLAERERGERERLLITILKIEIELKRRVFLEKAFQHPIKSRKIS